MPAFLPLPRFPHFPPATHHLHSAPLCSTSVPDSASSAAAAIQTSVRTALIQGRRRLSVDLLIAALDPRARTYDEDAASSVLIALLDALIPVLPVSSPVLRVVVSGAAAAVRVNKWVGDMKDVQVTVLGVREGGGGDVAGAEDADGGVDAVVLFDPGVDAVLEVRRLLGSMARKGVPVVVVNHPREDELYRMLGYGGGLPFEMTKFEAVFVLAPFALQKEATQDVGGEAQDAGAVPMRFVVMRQYPGKWELWRYLGKGEFGKGSEYELCAEFDGRPSASVLVGAVQQAMS
eukprot:GFKZ01014772.1.p2 GENE.GFKZ01014772.1~~GFKZ01014772.1.p2  ORF type:complete len:290 (+),score=49.37 GFKZ01014772.1:459-1328(+)